MSRKFLVEIAVPVQKSHCHKVGIHIRSFFDIVSCKDSKTAGIYLQGCIKTVLHTEICHGRRCPLGFESHIVIKFGHHFLQLDKEVAILLKFLVSFEADHIQKSNRIMSGLLPGCLIYAFEKILR